ncbi:hypothetical protein MCC93_01090 [Morococcus cerebrosus]|uniref:Uncharacterized protein n=1 Tax=Morococcus cerebrosus TaxID=1056807 RepID=A0A0C1EVK3_9NEIS|nr:hypothetical protein MCC93_01090 [Morococcus cerebrosus]
MVGKGKSKYIRSSETQKCGFRRPLVCLGRQIQIAGRISVFGGEVEVFPASSRR